MHLLCSGSLCLEQGIREGQAHPLRSASARVSCGHAVSVCFCVGTWGWGTEGEERKMFCFSSKLGERGGKRTVLSFIEKFGHGGLTVLVS